MPMAMMAHYHTAAHRPSHSRRYLERTPPGLVLPLALPKLPVFLPTLLWTFSLPIGLVINEVKTALVSLSA